MKNKFLNKLIFNLIYAILHLDFYF